ncbi:MAG: arylesterase [Betaproteobacteria bacterium]|nr:arylesterase [Betaproteobacteria bacterium]NBY17976.1 arylesterase [Betaproteobacteria bacterium]
MKSNIRNMRRLFLAQTLVLTALSALTPELANAVPKPPILLIFGDSLSAEYGLVRGSGWVALLERRLQQNGRDIQVVNASISGETTAGGRSRLGGVLARVRPRWVLIELGANDALRGLALESTEHNLKAMVLAIRESGAEPILAGMMIPPNFGLSYSERFRDLFGRVAKSQKAPIVPFLLAGIADEGPMKAELFQDDRIHPNAQAQSLILDNVWAVVGPLLRSK